MGRLSIQPPEGASVIDFGTQLMLSAGVMVQVNDCGPGRWNIDVPSSEIDRVRSMLEAVGIQILEK